MASVLFIRPATRFTPVAAHLGFPPRLDVVLGVRAFGLDVVLRAAPLTLEPRARLLRRAVLVSEYLLPDLPVVAVRAAFEDAAGAHPTCVAIATLVRASRAKVDGFRAISLERMGIDDLVAACALDCLPRVYP